jgi:PAS domain S-box-containing protein
MKTKIKRSPNISADHADAKTRENYWMEALRISELRYRRLFETAHDGILILDAETGEIIDVNPFLMDLLDYPFEELRGRRLWEIGQFTDIAANCEAFARLQENEYIRYENLPLRRRDGRQIQVEFVSNVYWVETHKVIQCNIRDISVRAEMKLDCDNHVAALELANGTKAAWLMAHSQTLRNPITAIASMLGLVELEHKLVEMRTPGDTSMGFDEAALHHIRRNFQRIVHFFNELCGLTGQGPLRLEMGPGTGAPQTGTTSDGSAKA